VKVSSRLPSPKSITVTALDCASLIQWIFEGGLVLADQLRRRADAPRRAAAGTSPGVYRT
jgi:hypothetical protein